MIQIHHLNCGSIIPPSTGSKVSCHCLLLEDADRLALVDAGVGLEDVRRPLERIGQPLIDLVGFQFDEAETAVRQIEAMGFCAQDVKHIILTHCDPDHAGGLADFPDAQVHVSQEELDSLSKGDWRYLPIQFAHGPRWVAHPLSPQRWFGLEARPVNLGFDAQVLLIPLFGHTLGHCGVAMQREQKWTLHVGDAYYLRVETTTDDHPVSLLAAQRAADDAQRRNSLEQIRRLLRDHGDEIEMFGCHDPTEMPRR